MFLLLSTISFSRKSSLKLGEQIQGFGLLRIEEAIAGSIEITPSDSVGSCGHFLGFVCSCKHIELIRRKKLLAKSKGGFKCGQNEGCKNKGGYNMEKLTLEQKSILLIQQERHIKLYLKRN